MTPSELQDIIAGYHNTHKSWPKFLTEKNGEFLELNDPRAFDQLVILAKMISNASEDHNADDSSILGAFI